MNCYLISGEGTPAFLSSVMGCSSFPSVSMRETERSEGILPLKRGWNAITQHGGWLDSSVVI